MVKTLSSQTRKNIETIKSEPTLFDVMIHLFKRPKKKSFSDLVDSVCKHNIDIAYNKRLAEIIVNKAQSNLEYLENR